MADDLLTLPEAARYLLDACEANPRTIGFRGDLWAALRACLEVPAIDVPADLPTEAHEFYRLLIADGFVLAFADGPGFKGLAWLAPPTVEPGRLSREQVIAVAELQEHGYGPVVNA